MPPNFFAVTPQLTEIADLCEEIRSADHVGRANRLARVCENRFGAIERDPDRIPLLEALLAHRSLETRLWAIQHCGGSHDLSGHALRAARELAEAGGEMGKRARGWLEWQAAEVRPPQSKPTPIAFDPMPVTAFACSQTGAPLADRAARNRMRAVRDVIVNSIRLWPRPAPQEPHASRLGGLPALPEGFVWPCAQDEPMLFLAQIDCAAVRAAVGENPLPERGLLVFFGDEAETEGCGPMGGGAVFHFDDASEFRRAAAPAEAFHILPECGIDFFLACELPDRKSRAFAELELPARLWPAYDEMRLELQTFGVRSSQFPSKLFGWPDLIQSDIAMAESQDECLLLQLGWYHDGYRRQCWGPGGHVYFALGFDDVASRRFDAAEMEVQTT